MEEGKEKEGDVEEVREGRSAVSLRSGQVKTGPEQVPKNKEEKKRRKSGVGDHIILLL